LHHYVVVRDDLPRGVLAAQVVHAAGESARLVAALPAGTHAVVLAASGEGLGALELALAAAGVAHAAVREPDAPYCGQLLAIGIAPAPRAALRRYVGRLPLLAANEREQRRQS